MTELRLGQKPPPLLASATSSSHARHLLFAACPTAPARAGACRLDRLATAQPVSRPGPQSLARQSPTPRFLSDSRLQRVTELLDIELRWEAAQRAPSR